MNIDVTNADSLDSYSNATANRVIPTLGRTNPVSPKPVSRPTTVANTVSRPFSKNVAVNVNSPITRPVAVSKLGKPVGVVMSTSNLPVSKPIAVAPVVNIPTVAPASIIPVGAGGGAMGGGGGSQSGSEEAASEETESPSQRVASIEEDKPFYKQYWFLGLLVGGIGGYFFAKNKGKNLIGSTLIGAGIVGVVGFGADKFIGKKPVEAPASAAENATQGKATAEAPAQ